MGIFGTCLFYGDGVITPAITVLGAVEGLEVMSPNLHGAIIPLTLVILLGLFMVQAWHQQHRPLFGPVMIVVRHHRRAGRAQIARHPEILGR